MALEAQMLKSAESLELTAPSALVAGQVLRDISGFVGVHPAIAGTASGDVAAIQIAPNIYRLAKTADILLFPGQKAYWVTSTNKVSYAGDVLIGTVLLDAAAAATTVDVVLNADPMRSIDFRDGGWDQARLLGYGISSVGGTTFLDLGLTAEAAMASILSHKSIAIANPFIAFFDFAIFDVGDNAALDLNIGLANAGHATDADSITESMFLHIDGTSLNLMAESDDGTTEVTTVDTTVDAVDDTFIHAVMDARALADIQLYVNGVNVLPDSVFKLDAATGPIKLLAHAEKTSEDTPGVLAVRDMYACAPIVT